MANVKPQIPNQAQEAKSNAASSNSVPQLRIAVQENSDAVLELQAQIARLDSRSQ